MSSAKPISTIVHAAKILDLLSKNIGNISKISQKLNLNVATVHRTLKTLEITEFAIQDPITRRYHLGPMIQKLSSDPLNNHHNLILIAHEYIEDLCSFSGETSGIQIRIGIKRVIIDEVESPHPIRFLGGKGHTSPVYTGAAGKVLLSEMNESELELLLDKMQLIAVGPNTITDRKALIKELGKVRRQGFATSLNEILQGASAIAVPVKNYFFPIALGLVGPEARVLSKQESYIEKLKKAAKKISNQLK